MPVFKKALFLARLGTPLRWAEGYCLAWGWGVGGTLGGVSPSAAVCTQIHLRQGRVRVTQTLGGVGGGRDVGQRSPVGEEEEDEMQQAAAVGREQASAAMGEKEG